jgi:hypothetical protein
MLCLSCYFVDNIICKIETADGTYCLGLLNKLSIFLTIVCTIRGLCSTFWWSLFLLKIIRIILVNVSRIPSFIANNWCIKLGFCLNLLGFYLFSKIVLICWLSCLSNFWVRAYLLCSLIWSWCFSEFSKSSSKLEIVTGTLLRFIWLVSSLFFLFIPSIFSMFTSSKILFYRLCSFV